MSPAHASISRSQAKKRTLIAQGASGVLVLAVVAIGIVGLPEPTPQGGLNQTDLPTGMPGMPGYESGLNTPSNTKTNAPTQTTIDARGLAQRLALLDNAPEIIDNTVIVDNTPDPGDDDTQSSGDANAIVKRVRYIGFINDPDTRHAFIRIDGKQRIVALGGIAKAGQDGFSDLTVDRINPNYIMLSDGETRARVSMANRVGQSITMISGEKVEVTPAAANGSLLTAEDEARIAAMPPRQQPMARRRLERERRGLPPTKERRAEIRGPQVTVKTSFNKKNKPDDE
ncbi:MAG: hypothetical protein ACWA5W_09690 [Phycisphaerales bacterium]